MKGFDVLKVKSAVKGHNKFDLSRTHLTTMNFGEIVPLLADETVPGDKFNINAEYFSRLAPLVKPTYGKFSFKTCTAFVPYHQLADDFDAWVDGKTTWQGSTTVFRHFTVGQLAYFVVYFCVTNSGATAAAHDFCYVDPNGNVGYRNFTAVGKYWLKVLNALGYATPQNVDLQTGSTWYTTVGQTKLSAMPLLAFFKLYNDYMSQSQRFNISALSTFLQNVKHNRATTGYTSAGVLTSAALKLMFDYLYLNYDNDYFTSAWQNAAGPLAAIDSVNSAYVPAGTAGGNMAVQQNLVDNYLQTASGQIGQRALDFLKDFDDWVRRNNYSGSRAVQQIYSRFGIKTDDYRSHYANVISTDVLPVQVGDVTATADATDVPLGDYAGKGIMNGNKSVSIQVSDYGLILILGYFTVVPMNAFGFDRKVLRNSPLDYYTPEFDGIGGDAISYGELFCNPTTDPTTDTSSDLSVFGYTERYNSYRYGRDQITGEFRDFNGGDMNCWHTGRDLTDARADGDMYAQSTTMNTLPQTNSEYNRIFADENGDVDHFYLTARFNVDAIRPMLNLNQVTQLGEGDTNVPRNGNVIS